MHDELLPRTVVRGSSENAEEEAIPSNSRQKPKIRSELPLITFSLPFLCPRNNLSNLLQKLGGDRGKQIEAALTRGTSQKMTTNSSTFLPPYIHAHVIISHSLPSPLAAQQKSIFFPTLRRRRAQKTAINVAILDLFFAPKTRGSTKGVMGRTEVEELCVLPPTIPHGSSPQSPHSPLFLIYLGR